MKKLMILGAGVYQVPLIKRAKEKGLYTIVVSIPGDYPGFKLADKIYYENTTDCEKILEIAQKENIDGIATDAKPKKFHNRSYRLCRVASNIDCCYIVHVSSFTV